MENNNYREKTYTILELNTEIKQVLWDSFPELIWVRGEITGFDKQKGSKNIFFQLQEKNPDKDQIISKITATIFNSDIKRILQKFKQGSDVELRDGLEVRVLCRIDVYPPWGEYKVVIKDIDPEFTLGKLAQTRAMIIKNLKERGLLDKNRQLVLSLVPQCIGLITQKGKEGYTDFISGLKKSRIYFKIRFYNASVQGEKVESEICEALDYFNQQQNVDAVVIVRGGGSKTDLSWFDNKKIAEKIAFMQTPVITGIGHRTDFTITDMVAFSFQQTPSIAATFFIERINEFLDGIDSLSIEIAHNSQNFTKLELQNLIEIKKQINRESTLFLERDKKELEENRKNLLFYYKEFFKNIRETIKQYSLRIDSSDPINIIRLGFSVSKVSGKTIKSIKEIKTGQNMVTTVSDGEIKSIINQ
ncbi:MAG: exodeoxyribonuclease VII large subunit [Candidatus Nealsonbacteria bacterium CG10_big_fil_rev_8_21_14_0_10_36_24]|uniref:Exodeoxyribonuclease 7 large subunit n=1 Tax=Candidatus Nealsonbacteria bacterium CG10_big_fil_rev_8_21_14_0_10_36_24 TaxID=1974710 RepID=A0A2M6NR84_9BACT|nr:MAG: exodeoxyribonuclease VII large subunit [Candidatus Nealsonbacteria bacterium CG10_big_fil_rev_8_21_14_0_10_36_24]